MTKFFKPVKRRKGMKDLTYYGALEQHQEAIARMHTEENLKALQDERGDLVLISGAPRPEPPPIPPYVRPKVSVWKVIVSTIKREVISIMLP